MTRPTLPAALAALALLATLAACSSADDTAADSAAPAAPATATTPAPGDTGAARTAGAATAAGAMMDPNTASRADLMAIPGVDSATADALIAGRPYENMLAVDRVLAPKLNETQRDTVYTRLFRPLDLNTASAEEIMLIPGVGPRMRHEFEEYRPYQNIEKFRREIRKYVDSAEVARLERYVTIR